MALVLDIETVGQERDELPGRAVDYLMRRLERDKPDEDELARRREELVERFGLDPTTGRVVVIGLLDTETDAEEALTNVEERELLETFWERFAELSPDVYVTFNGKRFDVPYINIRSAIRGVTPTRRLVAERSTTHPHFDVQEVLAANERRRRGNLDYFSAIFGIDSPKETMDGSQVGPAWTAGRVDDIARYCLADCRATAALFEKLKPFYL